LSGAIAPGCDSETGELREVLVAAPDPAGLEAGAVDPGWHGFRGAADPRLALAEWEAFVAALEAAGARVHDLRALAGAERDVSPNLHYTRDLAMALGGGCLLADPNPARRAEAGLAALALEGLGIDARPMREPIEFGDVFVAGRSLGIAGAGPRTGAAALRELREEATLAGPDRWLVVDFAPLATGVGLAHLDLGFNLLGERAALVHEPLLAARAALHDGEERHEGSFAELLEACGLEPLPVTAAVQERAGTNVLSLSPTRAVAYAEALEAGLDVLLDRAGVEAVVVPGANLIRSGGGPRCLSLPLVRA
jgi:arginine deiminase